MEYSSPFKKYSAPAFAGNDSVKLTPETAILVDCIPVMTNDDNHFKIVQWLERVQFAAKMSNWNIATLAVVISSRIAPKYLSLMLNAPLTKPAQNNGSPTAVTSEEFLTYLSDKLLAVEKASTEELLQFKMERDESIHDFCQRAAELISRSDLTKLPETAQVEFVTKALNKEWQDYIWYRKDKMDNFDSFYKELSEAEKRKPKKAEKTKNFHENAGKKSVTPAKSKPDPRTCFTCGQRGHIATHCPHNRSESTQAPNINLNFGPTSPASTPRTPASSFPSKFGATPKKGFADSKVYDSSSPYKPKMSKFNISAVNDEKRPVTNNQSRSRESVTDLSEN